MKNNLAPWHFGMKYAGQTTEWLSTDTEENYQKLLLHYNANLFNKINSKRKDLKKLGNNTIISIVPFTQKVISFIKTLPEDLLIYIPERKGFRVLAKELSENGIRVKTQKIIPGTFTNPATSYFMEENQILFLNNEYHQKIIKEHRKAGGTSYSLALLSKPDKDTLSYNHRSVKSLLVFFYLFLLIKKNYPFTFKQYAAKITKEELLFAKLLKENLPAFMLYKLKINEN
jgi:hypothetical protein